MPQTRTSLALTPAVIPLLQPRKLDYAMIKDAGFRNKNEFMLSYSLRTKNQDNHEEAKAILDGMRKIDEQQVKGADK